MTEATIQKLRAALSLAGAAGLALVGMVGAGHAETAVAMPVALVAPARMALDGPAAPHFQLSVEAALEQRLAFDQARISAAATNGQIAASSPSTAPVTNSSGGEQLGSGVASFYARSLAGNRTASGERFDPEALTAAHRTLPFGSMVRVTNPRNGRSVVVRINDRGPFSRGRLIDLSGSAAERIGIVAAGHGSVELELLAG